MDSLATPGTQHKIGFHYFPDTVHFRDTDLQAWLPELRALGAGWLILSAPPDRAIPELFLRGLLTAGIEPILHFQARMPDLPATGDLAALYSAYAKWGVHYVIPFDRPNSRSAWSPTGWGQEDLVERFLDRFLPVAELALEAGLVPVLPPLEPGGNYWDTAFLQTTLQSLQRRKQYALLEKLVISAYAWTWDKPLNWGAGGPERWPGARPYTTPAGEEDQRGFRVFDWYRAIAESTLHASCPIIVLGAGSKGDHLAVPPIDFSPSAHAQTNLAIARLAAGEPAADPSLPEIALDPLPFEVLCTCFWLLAASPTSPYLRQAWIQPDGNSLPVTGAVRQWVARLESSPARVIHPASGVPQPHPIAHYLLLPVYEWGVADWHLEVIRPFIKKFHPTVGFSLDEAAYAAQVTVIGNQNTYPDEDLDRLREAGCQVERIGGDGTNIATQLAER